MAQVSSRSLLEKLNPLCEQTFRSAVELCVGRTNRSVEVEHWLFRLLEPADSDLVRIFRQYDVNLGRVQKELTAALDALPRGSSRRDAQLSPELFDVMREAWVLASLEYRAGSIRSGHLLTALLTDRSLSLRLKGTCPALGKIPAEQLQKELPALVAGTAEDVAAPAGTGGEVTALPTPGSRTPALDQFTSNLTERAAKGEIDPVIGRSAEIRQMIDILTRRRQNNPILTGEAGVGKTAVVEGFAIRIAADDVPPALRGVVVRALDLGLLQAGAGVKGEFENRLKSVIAEVKASPRPIILFIDEAHTLIGGGGQAGQGDAANLLKPALARGELRTIAATTWAEYKKYFETDAAFKRRFQVVRIEEPDTGMATRMMRGLTATLEKHHRVRLLEEAVEDAVKLSQRYISDRQLPDKAVSLLDTACALVALSQQATPGALEDCRREIEFFDVERGILDREAATGIDHGARLAEVNQLREQAQTRLEALEKRLADEKTVVEEIHEIRGRLEEPETPEAERGKLAAQLAEKRAELTRAQGDSPLVHPEVGRQAVAEVVSGWTGIPVGKMVLDEVRTILGLRHKLEDRIIGQPAALEALARRIQTARANLVDPRRPVGVFLLVGPSGVGKTETAVALADILYGGDRNMVVVNMSEYKEAHKISRLTGSAKGYVGYGEGGVLTEAVRRRPHSIVLLDEVEKADVAVQELFYQVFDKGTLQDDRENIIDFKHTIILLTSNVGTDTIMKLCSDPDTCPAPEKLAEMLRPDLLKVFKPALLGRLTVVPYFPLAEDVLKQIIRLQLQRIANRLQENHRAAFVYDDALVDLVAARCKEVETGARNVDHILTGTLLPDISTAMLQRLAQGQETRQVAVRVENSGFTYTID
jgi:type VI secretion system protein VasG